jgi:hypothetical protein
MGGEGEGYWRRVDEKGQNEFLERGVMSFSTGKG